MSQASTAFEHVSHATNQELIAKLVTLARADRALETEASLRIHAARLSRQLREARKGFGDTASRELRTAWLFPEREQG